MKTINRGKFWIVLFGLATTALFVVTSFRLYKIQIIGDVAKDVSGGMYYRKTLPAQRGGIYDRNGKSHPLAVSVPLWKIFIDPYVIDEGRHGDVMREICKHNEFDETRVFKAVTAEKGRYHPIGETENRKIFDDLSTNAVLRRCVGIEKITRRNYPLDSHMSHVIGIVNSAGMALDGVEKTMNEYLVGKDGFIEGIANAKRKEIVGKRKQRVEPVNGNDVFMTFDRNIQYIVENALDEAITNYNARAGWVIVQNPKTGEILAMASRPTFSPHEYGSSPEESRWNRAIFTNFEPGSVMKALTFAAGINEGICSTNSLINCDPGLYAGRPLQDHVRGDITTTMAVKKSSNRAASRIAMQLGRNRMNDYLIDFGFGKKSGIDLMGESSGIVTPKNRWSDLQLIRIGIGHGIAVTGIQLISMYSTIANKGKMMRTYVIDKVVAPDGTIVLHNTPVILSNPISEKTADDMVFMLSTVPETGGTGRRAKIPGYTVAGKTGTAQMVLPTGGYSTTDYIGSFCGFFPASDPQITILVSLEAPRPNYHGGTVAAPVFAKIGAAIAQYLEIMPDDLDDFPVY
jgi:cell division protein FtsI/penicillin-binding protein 2